MPEASGEPPRAGECKIEISERRLLAGARVVLYIARSHMKPLIYITVLALSFQGAIPGLILCFDSAGHFEVEAVAEACCNGMTKTTGEAADVLLAAVAPAASTSGCGPCTDTLFSVPMVRLERDIGADDPGYPRSLLPSTAPLSDPTSGGLYTRRSQPEPFGAALIPVKTTALLI